MKLEINDKLIEHLALNNNSHYNMHKASEELQELALVLNQKLLKPHKVDDQEIIDEIGDVIIRMEILKKLYPLSDIQKRIDYKLGKFQEYINEGLYTGNI